MDKERITARKISEGRIFTPSDKTGYSAWAVIWKDAEKEQTYHLSFITKREGKNELYRQIPIDFWESMVLPLKYQVSFLNGDPNIINEAVFMRSDDGCVTWTETGRSFTPVLNHFCYESLSGGRLIRVTPNGYICFYDDEIQESYAEESTDGGNTWVRVGTVLKGYFGYPYRLKRLKDGVLALECVYTEAFGPSRPMKTRGIKRLDIRKTELQAALFASFDEGRTWDGPYTIFPGEETWEPDFVELDNGTLLFVNSLVQDAPQMRQYVFRNGNRFIPGPVYNVRSGTVPETFASNNEGVLAGANRWSGYYCSDDEGANWQEIAGMPVCGYQPVIAHLGKNEYFCVWHYGEDNIVGEVQQYIGYHKFSLEADFSGRTKLTLSRDKNTEGTGYINAFTFLLEADGRPLCGMSLSIITETGECVFSPKQFSTELITDHEGKVRISYDAFDRQRNVHFWYKLHGVFKPDGDRYKTCESEKYFAYASTAEAGSANPYNIYMAKGKVYVKKELLAEMPGLQRFVDELRHDRKISVEKHKDIPGFDRIIEFLLTEDILRLDENGMPEWIWLPDYPYPENMTPSSWIQTIEINDDFVS